MKIGVLGGTFNPIHNGHIQMADYAKKACGLDEVWVMPAGIPPHKDSQTVCSSVHRMKMCELACAEYDHIVASDFEIYSESNNYTYQTLQKLHETYPNHQFYFIMGQDSVDSFQQWKKPQTILNYAILLVFLRGNHFDEEKKRCLDTIKKLNKEYSGEILSVDFEPDAISSSEIRSLLYSQDQTFDFDSVLPKKVYEYIKLHRLYEPMVSYDTKSFKKKLKDVLKPSRYTHSLGVADTAMALAKVYGYPEEIAYVAGVLHDCAKYMSKEELLSFAKKHKIRITDGDVNAPHLLHAPIGAYIARNTYNIKDEEILHAILVHTTGCPAMSLLDKIVFVADYIEPGRDKAPRLEELRKLSKENIDITTLYILEDTIHYIKDSKSYLDERTLLTYEYYKKEYENEHERIDC